MKLCSLCSLWIILVTDKHKHRGFSRAAEQSDSNVTFITKGLYIKNKMPASPSHTEWDRAQQFTTGKLVYNKAALVVM